MPRWRRTHTCGELRESHIGQTVVLNGWVNTYRDHNIFVFVDLRDRYGMTQLVFEPERGLELFRQAQELRSEWVIAVRGTVARRLPGKENPDLATGTVELKVEDMQVLNRCPTPPFEVVEITEEAKERKREKVREKGKELEGREEQLANEELRLQYRYLDLRRPSLQRILGLRHRLNKVIRDYLDARGFLEIETPLLGRSTPEGARDYLVPSRLFPGSWYALPQSPQLYKQLLMVAGYDKYFQIARCLRDEDLRADRQPEFTQLDLEMSFVDREDIFHVIEGLTAEIFQKCLGVTIPLPLPRLSYPDAMLRYGTDKPDLRYGLEIVDLCGVVPQTEFRVFHEAVASGGKVRGLNARGAAEAFSRKGLDELTEHAKRFGAKGLVWIKVEGDKLTSPIEKFLPPPAQQALRQALGASPGDLLLIVADQEEIVCQALGNLRTRLASLLNLVDPNKPDFKIAWIVDFPQFLWDDEEKRWVANHHPFTAPLEEDWEKLERDPAGVRAQAYDLVINGYECGGGSIRIHNPELQARVFAVLGMTPEQARQRFGFLLDALRYGAPPHGGIALGLDRWVMILAGTTNIRDVIAFPKNQKARDLMTGAPAPVDPKQLKELGL
ncbi:MAG: aspartate--tRNA ligase [Gemmataceae bacterium]|nr:aspartate--tRNA ligase [Gemmataceae bacterium]MDW8265886.1 aspartate--tRNA ligase [Gemmataceae bacterium]